MVQCWFRVLLAAMRQVAVSIETRTVGAGWDVGWILWGWQNGLDVEVAG